MVYVYCTLYNVHYTCILDMWIYVLNMIAYHIREM